jgi:hypothetical protein
MDLPLLLRLAEFDIKTELHLSEGDLEKYSLYCHLVGAYNAIFRKISDQIW